MSERAFRLRDRLVRAGGSGAAEVVESARARAGRSRVAISLIALLALAACFGADPNLTASGKGRPRISVEFPELSPAGSVQEAVLRVSNPGPADMNALSVSFNLLGSGRAQTPIVTLGSKGTNPAVVAVHPQPRAVSPDGVVYVFEGLQEEASMRIVFKLKVPTTPGLAANAVIVSDAQEPDRARGAPLRTTVGR